MEKYDFRVIEQIDIESNQEFAKRLTDEFNLLRADGYDIYIQKWTQNKDNEQIVFYNIY